MERNQRPRQQHRRAALRHPRLADLEQRHHQHRPRRGRRRHYEPTSRERPQDPGFGAEGFFVECGEDDLTAAIWLSKPSPSASSSVWCKTTLDFSGNLFFNLCFSAPQLMLSFDTACNSLYTTPHFPNGTNHCRISRLSLGGNN